MMIGGELDGKQMLGNKPHFPLISKEEGMLKGKSIAINEKGVDWFNKVVIGFSMMSNIGANHRLWRSLEV